jgi:hypothetical protein
MRRFLWSIIFIFPGLAAANVVTVDFVKLVGVTKQNACTDEVLKEKEKSESAFKEKLKELARKHGPVRVQIAYLVRSTPVKNKASDVSQELSVTIDFSNQEFEGRATITGEKVEIKGKKYTIHHLKPSAGTCAKMVGELFEKALLKAKEPQPALIGGVQPRPYVQPGEIDKRRIAPLGSR